MFIFMNAKLMFTMFVLLGCEQALKEDVSVSLEQVPTPDTEEQILQMRADCNCEFTVQSGGTAQVDLCGVDGTEACGPFTPTGTCVTIDPTLEDGGRSYSTALGGAFRVGAGRVFAVTNTGTNTITLLFDCGGNALLVVLAGGQRVFLVTGGSCNLSDCV